MIIKQISILKQFQCTGAACPSNCCRGWKIPIDDDAYEKYITEKGFLGFILRCFLVKKEELTSFRHSKRQYRCPFWGLDRLCGLQKRHGTDYMPLVCVQFPRQLSNFGSFCEETLYLACPEAARLFIEQARAKIPFDFVETTGEAGYEENTTNDDFDFLNYLLKTHAGVTTNGDYSAGAVGGNATVNVGDAVLMERIKWMETLLNEKDERIRDLQSRLPSSERR